MDISTDKKVGEGDKRIEFDGQRGRVARDERREQRAESRTQSEGGSG